MVTLRLFLTVENLPPTYLSGLPCVFKVSLGSGYGLTWCNVLQESPLIALRDGPPGQDTLLLTSSEKVYPLGYDLV